jgi:hypothetical protein
VRKLCQGFSHLADSREEGRKRITNFEVRMWEISLNPMGNGIIRKQRRGLRVRYRHVSRYPFICAAMMAMLICLAS